MSADRPDFEAIKERLNLDLSEHHKRGTIKRRLDMFIRAFSDPITSSSSMESTRLIATDDESRLFVQAVSDIWHKSGNVSYVSLHWTNQITGNSESAIIFSVQGLEVLNHKGDQLRGSEIQEAMSILDFMENYENERAKALVEEESRNLSSSHGLGI